MEGVGRCPAADAVASGITGPCLRASGVNYDVRKAHPYLVYDRSSSTSRSARTATTSTAILVRMGRCEQSIRIAEQGLEGLPGGSIQVDWKGKAIDPAAYVDRGKQGKTEGLLLGAHSAVPESPGPGAGRPAPRQCR